jgi:hypothetical protein
MNLDFEKFKRAVHYVIWKAGSHQGFGSTKLNKALWFAEARVYVLKGHPITGAKYTRQEFGPVPQPVMPAREELQRAGIIELWKEGLQTRFRTKTKPDMSAFPEYEIAALDYWIKEIDEEHTAQSISDKSHEYGWEIARMGEEIPLYAIRAERARHPKDEELEWARKEAERLGLL